MKTLIAILILGFVSSPAAALELDANGWYYAMMLTSRDAADVRVGAKLLYFAGAEETPLTDIAAAVLLEHAAGVHVQSIEDAAAWLVKLLGHSGQIRYLDTLTRVEQAGKNKVSRAAKAEKKGLVVPGPPFDPSSISIDEIRAGVEANRPLIVIDVRDDILSGSASRIRNGAQRMYYSLASEPSLVAAATARLDLSLATRDKELVDALSFLCKGLGRAGVNANREILERVASHAADPKLRKYASQSLESG